MTNPDNTLIAALLDRSGSMQTSKTATEDGWRELINEQRHHPGQCRVTLAQFDTEYELLYSATELADVPDFSVEPRGRTALLDACGKFITTVGEHLAALPEEQRPGHVICLIMTDGMENASYEWDWDDVRSLITRQQDQWAWKFIFLGANIDAVAVGNRMGVPQATAMTFNANDSYAVSGAYERVAREVVRGRSGRTMGFTPEDRTAAVGTPTT